MSISDGFRGGSSLGYSRDYMLGDTTPVRGSREVGGFRRGSPATHRQTSESSSYLDYDTQSEILSGSHQGAGLTDLRTRSDILQRHEMDNEYDADDGRRSYSMLDHSEFNTSLTRSPSRSRSIMDLNSSRNGWSQDTDSGISNTLSPKRTYRSSLSSTTSPQAPLSVDPTLTSSQANHRLDSSYHGNMTSPGDNLYRTQSITSLDSSLRGPIKYGSTFDLSRALEESEGRRQLLVDRLKDAQDTIRLQSQRLNQVEGCAKDASFQVDDLKFKEMEAKKRLEAFERERKGFHDKEMEQLKAREDQQKKMDSSDMEVRTLRASYNLLQSECEKKKEVIDQTRSAMCLLEEDNQNLTKAKESMMREVAAMKQSLEITRSRNEYLENQYKDTKLELDRLREDNRALLHESTGAHKKYTELKSSTGSMKDENSALSAGLQALNDEKNRLLKQTSDQQSTIADLKASMSSLSADRERFFQEKLDLTQKIQTLIHDLETSRKNKLSSDDQVNDLNVDLAQAKLEVDKHKEDKTRIQDELAAVKKVGEVLSVELANSRCKMEKASEQVSSLEQTKHIAFQQHDLYEQEIKTMETQLDNTRKSMDALRKDHMKERDSTDEHASKLKDEIRQLKSQRNTLELKCHEQEARIKQTDTNLKDHSELLTKEMESWKDSCDKLSASLGRKEMEIQTLMKKLHDLENETGYLKVNHDTYQSQYEELVEIREECLKSQEENRRLLQERAENQQVIQLLEMQKSILAKTSEGNLGKAQSAQQLQLQMEQLTAEYNLLQDKTSQLEKEKDEFKQQMEKLKKNEEIAEIKGKVEDLERQNKQLRDVNNMVTEQLTSLEQEKMSHQSQQENSVPKLQFVKLEREKYTLDENYSHMKVQLEELEERHHKLLTERKSSADASKNAYKMEQENDALESQVTMLKSQLVLTENSKKRKEDTCVKLEKQVDELHQQSFKSSQGQTAETLNLQRQVRELQSEVDGSRSMVAKQEAVIHSLREVGTANQSLDDVGQELNHMRTELQKLMEVIQVKDQEIEELEEQLVLSKKQVASKQRLIDEINTDSGDKPTVKDQTLHSKEHEKGDLEQQLDRLKEENEDFSEQVSRLRKEKERAVEDAEELREANEDMQAMFDEDRDALMDKLRKELKAKDRQIESLEEQLHRSSHIEIKKLKRDAGRVEILQAENKRLQNQLRRESSRFNDEDILPFTPPEKIEITNDILKAQHNGPTQLISDESSEGRSQERKALVGTSSDKNDKKELSSDKQDTFSNGHTPKSADVNVEFEKLLYDSDDSDEEVNRHVQRLGGLNRGALKHKTNENSNAYKTDAINRNHSTTTSSPSTGDSSVDSTDKDPIPSLMSSTSKSDTCSKHPVSSTTAATCNGTASTSSTLSKSDRSIPHSSKTRASSAKMCSSDNCHLGPRGLATTKNISRAISTPDIRDGDRPKK